MLHVIDHKLIEYDKKSNKIIQLCSEMNEKFSQITEVKTEIERLGQAVKNLKKKSIMRFYLLQFIIIN